jgi:hypothetical protein
VSRALAGPLLLALALRLLAIGASDRVVADVGRYEKVSRHLLEVSWNPYETKRLYPYPPPWAAVEAAAGALARRGVLPFAIAVKLPVLAADLLIVALLGLAARERRAPSAAPWLYAAHPVALLIGAVHGQFDAIPLLGVLLALSALAHGRRDASALALSAAIATKSFPVLLLPLLAAHGRADLRSTLRYVFLATAPGALLLVPFALADLSSLLRELLAYSGIADFGWTGLLRGCEWLLTGVLPRSEARFWPAASFASKLLFLGAWLALLAALRSGRLRLSAERASLAVVLAFLSLYGLQSAQYLLWAVPLAALRPGRAFLAYSAAVTSGLIGFYLFLAPGVLWPRALVPALLPWAGRLWLAGVAATLAAALFWLLAILREGQRLRAATDAR